MTLETGETRTLNEAVGIYVESFKTKESDDSVHRELFKFVQWCGGGRTLMGIKPSEIGDYAEQVGGTGTTPLATERLQVIRGFLSYARKQGLIQVNLAQHVRIRKSKSRLLGEAKADVDAFELTAEGHSKLVTQVESLKSERQPLALQIQKAAADKDVRENAPLEAAREQLGLVEARIREIEDTLKKAVVVDTSKRKKSKIVNIGAKVSVKDMETGRQASYTLVGRTETNPMEARISDVSPLGKALVGKSAGDEIVVQTPRGLIRFSVVKVS
ncbi:MAG: transcription elongation factor GreA [Chloroflexi bacterium]|nr:transcription elongation factor GreA [Chloroflexota bacterium]MDA1228684.1 transcription elongation factor GreA [Chloroflexota bacterium]